MRAITSAVDGVGFAKPTSRFSANVPRNVPCPDITQVAASQMTGNLPRRAESFAATSGASGPKERRNGDLAGEVADGKCPRQRGMSRRLRSIA